MSGMMPLFSPTLFLVLFPSGGSPAHTAGFPTKTVLELMRVAPGFCLCLSLPLFYHLPTGPLTRYSNVSVFNPSRLHEIPVTTYSKVVAISPTSSSSLRTLYILPTQNVNTETSIWLKKKFYSAHHS